MLSLGDSQRVAILAGGSGLVGSYLLEILLNDISISKVILLTRRPLGLTNSKITEVITDFKQPQLLSGYFSGADILFCCLGTTIKKAGSKEAFYEVDYSIPVLLARLAHEALISRFIVISSLGADAHSSNFYLKTKGEMERDIALYRFHKLAIVRPSLLLGPRKEFRFGEKLAKFFSVLLFPVLIGPFKKYRPIHRDFVAKAMYNLSNSVNNQRIYETKDLIWLGK